MRDMHSPLHEYVGMILEEAPHRCMREHSIDEDTAARRGEARRASMFAAALRADDGKLNGLLEIIAG